MPTRTAGPLACVRRHQGEKPDQAVAEVVEGVPLRRPAARDRSPAPRGHGLRAAELLLMRDLHRLTGRHILLGVRDGDEVDRHGDGRPLAVRCGGVGAAPPLTAGMPGSAEAYHQQAELWR